MHKVLLLASVFFVTLSFPVLLKGSLPPALAKDIRKPNSDSKETRPPSAAGPYYPASALQLRKSITAMIDNIPYTAIDGQIYAAIAPHAAYAYSGKVAAYTYKQLSNVEFDTIVIIGHDSGRNAVAHICPVDYFQTPLGKVPVDREMADKMLAFNRRIRASRLIHSGDHTIEVQLPFLQIMDKDCMIVPVLFGNPTPENCQILADAIISSAGEKNVFVLASTDMSHYPTYEIANRIDGSTLEMLKTMDVNSLFEHLDDQVNRRNTPDLVTAMCSRGGVGTAILFAREKGADHVQILHYANSGDAPIGDKQRVVGYSSALFIKTTGGD